MLNEIVITSSSKRCLQKLLEKNCEKNACVLGDLLKSTRVCHYDVPVIKVVATLAYQNLTVLYS